MVFSNNLLMGAASSTGGAAAGYVPKGAIKLSRASTQYLNRTPSSASNRKTWTYSTWCKLGEIGDTDDPCILAADDGSGSSFTIIVTGGDPGDARTDTFFLESQPAGATSYGEQTTAKFRDPTAWYHVVVVYDSTLAAGANRIQIYVNGAQQAKTDTYGQPTLDLDLNVNDAQPHYIGKYGSVAQYYDGYLSETILLDGYAGLPSDFGEENSDGVWIPKDPTTIVTAEKSTNGFWLDFADSSALGNDVSYSGLSVGTDNSFTTNNTPVWVYDRPADSGSDTGNYATLNVLKFASYLDIQDGNLGYRSTSGGGIATSTIMMSSGKWYWEVTVGNSAVKRIGIVDDFRKAFPTGGYGLASSVANVGDARYLLSTNGNKGENGTESAYGNSYTTSNVIMVALDMDNGKIWWGEDGTWHNSGDPAAGTNAAYTDLSGSNWFAAIDGSSGTPVDVFNFGQSAFAHTPPTDFKALNTANFPAPTITKPSNQFLPILYEGNGGGQRVGNFIPFTDSHTVDNSCMFITGDSDGLTRTPGTASNLKQWTFSTWIKPGDESRGELILAGDWNGDYSSIRIDSNLQLTFENYISSTWKGRIDLDRVMGQSAEWIHIFFRYDSTPASPDGDDVYFAINGVQSTNITSTASSPTYPSQNQETIINTAVLHAMAAGGTNVPSTEYYDGYMAETIMVDGYALSPSVFGQTDTSTNRWIPKEVTAATLNTAGGGSSGFGDEGFYLEYGTAADLGDDTSPEINDWAESGSLGANNQTIDTPTKNFATLNPNQEVWNAAVTLTKGNLHGAGTTTDVTNNVGSTIGYLTSGKWILAVNPATKSSYRGDPYIFNENFSTATANPITSANAWGASFTGGTGFSVANLSTTNDRAFTMAAAAATDDLILLAVDIDALKVWFGWYDDSAAATYWCGSATSFDGDPAAGTGQSFMLTGATFNFGFQFYSGREADIDFGQSGLLDNVTIPTGFKFLNQDNMAANTAGITGFSWIKNRDATDEHIWQDRVRGVYEYLESSTTDIEATDTNSVQRFLQQGVQIGNMAAVNTSAESLVLWQWAANGTGSSNTDGDLASSVSVNSTAGFSVVSYTGHSASTASTVGHGLGATADLVIVKNRAVADGWSIYHKDCGATEELRFTATAASANSAIWNNTAPSTSAPWVFTVGTSHSTNGPSEAMIAYVWKEVEGYSKFGSYTGSGNADGPFIYTGFKPAFLMVKRTDAISDWEMRDFVRDPYNEVTHNLRANLVDVESPTADAIDFTSNGFKIRNTASSWNTDTGTYIYMAWAENPFGGSGVAQAKAR